MWLLGRRSEFSSTLDGRSGGVAVLLSPLAQEAFGAMRWHVVEPGRILLADCFTSQATDAPIVLTIACVHLVMVGVVAPAALLRRLRCALPPDGQHPMVVMGDFNSVKSEDGRLHVP